MAVTSSRRDVRQGTAAALGVSALASAALGPVRAQGASASSACAEEFFYREDWFGPVCAFG
jgi:hypothetical protein